MNDRGRRKQFAMPEPITIHPVVLCGGSGTRLWPASRKAYPKQFVPLLGETSLYQQTLKRFAGAGFAEPLVMTAEDFRFMATEQAAEIGLTDARVVIEPVPRDTAPAILAAAVILERETPGAMMLVAPSDHVIADLPAFLKAVEAGKDALTEESTLVAFGVTPDRPETGYGYLELACAPERDRPAVLKSFREKPDLEAAQDMLASGHYLWNAGLFLFRAADVIAAFETHAPESVPAVRAAVENSSIDLGFLRLDAEAYSKARAISFDYAVMEKASPVIAVPMSCHWSDLGAWDALWQVLGGEESEDGVVTRGAVTAVECRDSYLQSDESGTHLVGLGLDGMVAVAMRDAVLVADKSRAQEIKKVVELLRATGVDQADDYPRFHRPWGWYETLCIDDRFQVKRIMVRPGGILSLQSHHHRSEHWIVVAGTAEVTIGEDVKLVTENESVYIPLGQRHRMANPGKVPMFLIEVQTGSYLGEDDIIRYEDIYDRK